MNRKCFFKVIILLLIIVIFVTFLNYPIFKACKKDDVDVEFQRIIESNYEKSVCVLDYTYTTGAGWSVLNSTDKKLIGEQVALMSFFDPRLLKENKEFNLDYLAQYIVTFTEKNDIKMDNENVTAIQAEEIVILYNTDKKYYKLTDLSLIGIFKSFLGIFDSKYKLSA